MKPNTDYILIIFPRTFYSILKAFTILEQSKITLLERLRRLFNYALVVFQVPVIYQYHKCSRICEADIDLGTLLLFVGTAQTLITIFSSTTSTTGYRIGFSFEQTSHRCIQLRVKVNFRRISVSTLRRRFSTPRDFLHLCISTEI